MIKRACYVAEYPLKFSLTTRKPLEKTKSFPNDNKIHNIIYSPAYTTYVGWKAG